MKVELFSGPPVVLCELPKARFPPLLDPGWARVGATVKDRLACRRGTPGARIGLIGGTFREKDGLCG